MTSIVVATCRANPDLSAGNAHYADALRDKGATVSVRAWNADPIEAFVQADAVILRQTWDYMTDPGGFAAWAARAERLGAQLIHDARTIIWNNDKRTISELAAANIQVPITVPIHDTQWPDQVQGDRVVLKPVFGGDGVGVRLATRETYFDAVSGALAEAAGRPFLAQEFLPEIADGEIKMSCLGDAAVLSVRVPAKDGFAQWTDESGAQVIDPPASAVASVRAIADWYDTPLHMYRVDGVMRGAEFIMTELELTDPSLHLQHSPEIASVFAEATLNLVKG